MTKKTSKKKSPSVTFKKIEKYIEKNIKPYIQLDGGDIEFIAYDEISKQVKIRLMGACVGCPLSSVTLKICVEKQLQKAFSAINEVIMID